MTDGKKCPSCGYLNVPGAFRCRSCGTDVEFVAVEQYSDSDFKDLDVDKFKNRSNNLYESEYKAARAISSFLSFVGWLLFLFGIVVALKGMSVSWQVPEFSTMTMAIPGIGLSMGGLISVAAAQVTRATVDNADHTREILILLKERLKNI